MKTVAVAIVLLACTVYAMAEVTTEPAVVNNSPFVLLRADDPKAVLATGVTREHFKVRGFTMTSVDEVQQKQSGIFELFKVNFQATKDSEDDASTYNCKATVHVSHFMIRGHQPVKVLETDCEKAQ